MAQSFDNSFDLSFEKSVNFPVLTVKHCTYLNSNDGIILVDENLSTGPFTYVWTKDSVLYNSQGYRDLNSLAPGIYELTITDSLGDTYVTSTTIFNGLARLNVTSNVIPVNIPKGSNGVIQLFPTGGSGSYGVDWDDILIGESFDLSFDNSFSVFNNTPTIRYGLQAGYYGVTVTSTDGQSVYLTVEVIEPDSYEVKQTNKTIANHPITGTGSVHIQIENVVSNLIIQEFEGTIGAFTYGTITDVNGIIIPVVDFDITNIPVGKSIYKGVYTTEFGGIAKLEFSVSITHNYSCANFKITNTTIDHYNRTLTQILTVNSNIQYRLNDGNWIVRTSNTISVPVGENTIQYKDELGCTLTYTFTMYELENLTITNSLTVSYSPDTDMFVSFHDYKPNLIINTNTKLFSISNVVTGDIANCRIALHNTENRGEYYGVKYNSFIDKVFNDDETVVYNNVEWESNTITLDKLYLKRDTIDYITIWNNYQCTGKILLENLVNIRNIEYKWFFNDLRDVVKEDTVFITDHRQNYSIYESALEDKYFYDKARFIGTAITVRYEIDNLLGNIVYLSDLNINRRKSYR